MLDPRAVIAAHFLKDATTAPQRRCRYKTGYRLDCSPVAGPRFRKKVQEIVAMHEFDGEETAACCAIALAYLIARGKGVDDVAGAVNAARALEGYEAARFCRISNKKGKL